MPILLLLVLLLSVAELAACVNDFVGVMPIVKDDSDDSGELPDGKFVPVSEVWVYKSISLN